MGKMILNGVPYGVTPKETINMKPYSEITLWENANGLSVSSPTSISLVDDINNYDALCIIHAAGVETTFRSSQIIPVSNIDKTGNTNFGIFDVGANNYYYAVLIYTDDTHITLSSWGSQYPIIYYKIIGIKYGGNLSPIIYSTDEREVGVWTDGKPLYQKTFEVTLNANSYLIDMTSLNIDNVVSHWGFMLNTNDIWELHFPYYDSSNWYSVGNYNRSDKNYYVTSTNNMLNQYNRLKLTIQYTKTTDVPGSGTYTTMGTPAVHYSTDWHVVGTWWNGKPIYEKTFHFTTENLPADRATIEKIYDFDELVGIDGYFGYQHYSNDFRNYKLGEAPSQLTNKAIYLLCEGNDQVNNIQDLDFNFNGLDRSKVTYISATVRITKTTD